MAKDDVIPGIPGVAGRDYEVVNFGGKYYVVYKDKLPGGTQMMTAWRVSKEDVKLVSKNAGNIRHITKGQFSSLHVFGDIGEIVRQGQGDEKPLQTWLRDLMETYGRKVSWLRDSDYMEVFFAGIMEGVDPGVLAQRLKRTEWYQSRTAAQRTWELDMSKTDQKAAIETTSSQMTSALQDLYGPTFRDLGELGLTGSQIQKWALEVASGQFGSPEDGFQVWLDEQRRKAEKVEGSQAWIDRETAAEQQRGFLNRPEDMFDQIRDDAAYWLGPGGTPSDDTLKKWADRLVSERASDADWKQFLKDQAQRLYPWLGTDTPWQEFADPYRRMTEELWGRPVGWEDPVLRSLGSTGPDGAPSGAALTFADFEHKLRQSAEFWQSPTAAEEGFGLLNTLNQVFRGVG